jgi:hypothetical protein
VSAPLSHFPNLDALGLKKGYIKQHKIIVNKGHFAGAKENEPRPQLFRRCRVTQSKSVSTLLQQAAAIQP